MSVWLIPCNPGLYDTEAAFQEYGTLSWHQTCRAETGDIAYMYVTSPVKEIRCKCSVEAVDLPVDPVRDFGYEIDEEFCSRVYTRYMELKLLRTYDTPALCYEMLKRHGLTGAVRSQRRASEELAEYIRQVTETI